MMRDIGKNIRDPRVQQNMTQDQLAERLFVTRQTVSNYETGRSRPDVDMLIKIAQALDADIHDILYEPEQNADKRKRIIVVVIVLTSMAIFGKLLARLDEYTYDLVRGTYEVEQYLIVNYLLYPPYFLELGYLLMGSLRFLQKAKPITSKVSKWIRWIGNIAWIFSLLFTIPFLFDVFRDRLFGAGIHMPNWYWGIGPVFFDLWGSIWFPLLTGLLLGIPSNWRIGTRGK